MRYVITHLKAPWPLGAVVGDVLELETVPVWAVGKCKPTDEALTMPVESSAVTSDEAQALAAIQSADAQAKEEIAALAEKATKGKK